MSGVATNYSCSTPSFLGCGCDNGGVPYGVSPPVLLEAAAYMLELRTPAALHPRYLVVDLPSMESEEALVAGAARGYDGAL